ncbi:glucose-6-phosphate dehydrogenase [uncultured Leifsonia sp.]|uniref:glucose-6-phosphate dehydrogenase n=1 Tax=uncultured Leifsonia sp. TaxID=340359 RepID=UPI0025F63473|nr:glucose-6-phosphate dehydrogenase [uncultured Leifsonia sp.]
MTQTVGTLVILGASGDLSSRLLLPAVGQLLTNHPERRFQLVGAGAEDWTDAKWRQTVRASFKTVKANGPAVEQVLKSTAYLSADVTKPAELQRIFDACEGTPALYFALPPAITARACDALSKLTLPAGLTLALEKPFGTDKRSATALNKRLATLVPEERIHRVDHFLGNSTVLNLIGLRFANSILEPVWNGDHIQRVDIVYDETLGLEGRARYYDNAGALMDMIQSHLLQVLAVFAMEPPSALDATDLRDAKATVLRATRVWGDDPAVASRRARYTAGTIDGRKLPAYTDEPGVDPARDTETLAELTVEIDNWRWAGVPITLRSGKALGSKRREILVTFKPARHIPRGLTGHKEPTMLRIMLAPDAMSLELNINGPDDPHVIERVALSADFGPGLLLAYGEVLEGILDGDPSLSVRGDTAVEMWRIVAPVISAWKKGDVPLQSYRAGSAGPASWKHIG